VHGEVRSGRWYERGGHRGGEGPDWGVLWWGQRRRVTGWPGRGGGAAGGVWQQVVRGEVEVFLLWYSGPMEVAVRSWRWYFSTSTSQRSARWPASTAPSMA
jgi:hypothetical protein